MRTKLVTKSGLSAEQLAALNVRLKASTELEGECGPINAWNTYAQFLYALVLIQDSTVIGVVEASGRPICSPRWWIDSAYRGRRFGNELIDLLAAMLKEEGVIRLGSMPIQTPGQRYDEQSTQMAQRLRSHFAAQPLQFFAHLISKS